MKNKVLLLASVFALGLATPVRADIILSDLIFRDLGATGFGNAPRLLTLQQNVLEAGGTVAGAGGTTLFIRGGVPTVPETFCTGNGDCGSGSGGGTRTGANESLVYSVAALGWFSGAQVGIGLDTDETNQHPLSFNTLTLTLYNSAGTALGSFSGNAPVDISVAFLDAQQGNGNSVFDLRLDAAQQAQYDTILAANGGAANVFEGLRASFGCGAFGSAVCNTAGNFESTDGPDSFLAFQAAAVPGPVAGAGVPGLIAACFTLFGLSRLRRYRQSNGFAA